MQTNFLIIGSGISGLNFALNAAKKGKVVIVTKKHLIDSNTNFAQGGIAAVLDKTDRAEDHIKDTMEAGVFHNNTKAVKFMVENSAKSIYRLIDLGVQFEKEHGELKLTREGGHSRRRIAYTGDYTGQEIERVLIERVKEHINITVFENAFALKLIVKNKTCYGVQIIHKNHLENIYANQVVLATGGLGQIFGNTTNPDIATGDGVAMGLEAGCKTKDLEFIQFHPTALAKKSSPRFLISETVRGEGAILQNKKGEKFMEHVHPLKDLAPRDIVAREIFSQIKNGQVFLNISHKKQEYLEKRFPKIYQNLKNYKIDMARDLIPIIPAAHYSCGGIVTNLKGQTSVKNLFALGEVAYTGVHGANRLASNSLLEALVFSNQIIENLKPKKIKNVVMKKPLLVQQNSSSTKKAKNLRKELQEIMWQYCGIVRSRKLIAKIAIPKIKNILKKLSEIKGTNVFIGETRNMAIVALEILKEAYKREKSLGCHYVQE